MTPSFEKKDMNDPMKGRSGGTKKGLTGQTHSSFADIILTCLLK